jgi:transmembrane sensor
MVTFRDLLEKYVNDELDVHQVDTFIKELTEPANWNTIESTVMVKLQTKAFAGHASAQVIQSRFEDMLSRADKASTSHLPRITHRIYFLRTAWFRYAAAIVILFGIGAYLWNTQQKKTPASTTEASAKAVKNDVAPGNTKATLTLSNGRKVELTPETGIITEPGIAIQNANGRLEYGKAEKVVFNTMSTPRGGQYQLTLPDGTNVWLNAASSITYPTAFTSGTREVTITGEAYFEVRKNRSKPFIVKTPKEDITVLGTYFNINAYPDEAAMKTTLLEGAVRIGNITLQPGQAYQDGKIVKTNVNQDIAWKNGVFNFHQVALKRAMIQLSRWYDVDIEFIGDVSDIQLGGKIGMQLSLQQVLKGLEDADIRFELAGKKLTVIRK